MHFCYSTLDSRASLGLLYSQSSLLSTLQPWVSLGNLYSQSPLLSALQPWVSPGLVYSQSPLLSTLQPWVSLGLLYNQSPPLFIPPLVFPSFRRHRLQVILNVVYASYPGSFFGIALSCILFTFSHHLNLCDFIHLIIDSPFSNVFISPFHFILYLCVLSFSRTFSVICLLLLLVYMFLPGM
jgi:hypothetical protein